MSQQVILVVDDECKAIGDSLKSLIVGVKDKSTGTLEDIKNAAAPLIGALGSLQNAGVDLQKVDNRAYIIKCIDEALQA